MEHISWEATKSLTDKLEIKDLVYTAPTRKQGCKIYSMWIVKFVVQFNGCLWSIIDPPFTGFHSSRKSKLQLQDLKLDIAEIFARANFDYVTGFERVVIDGRSQAARSIR